MKRIIQAVVVAALFTSTQAMADDPARMLPSQWTNADRNAAAIAKEAFVSAFPESVDDGGISVASGSSHAGGRAAGIAPTASAFPGSVDDGGVTVPSMSTYADKFAPERTRQASGAADPALSQ